MSPDKGRVSPSRTPSFHLNQRSNQLAGDPCTARARCSAKRPPHGSRPPIGCLRSDSPGGEATEGDGRAPRASPRYVAADIFSVRSLALALAVGLVYLALSWVGLLTVVHPEGIASLWPATGWALAVLLLSPPRRWWVLVPGMWWGHFAADMLFGDGFAISWMFSVVNGVECVLGAWAILWATGGRAVNFRRTRDVVALAVGGCLAAAPVAALGGAAFSCALGHAPSFWRVWYVWWAADAMGVLVVVPLVVTWCLGGLRRWRLSTGLEAAWLLAGLVLTVAYVFSGSAADRTAFSALPFVPVAPFLLWAGLRFDPRVASLATAALAVVAAALTAAGHGPLASLAAVAGAGVAIATLQVALAVFTLSTLILSAVTEERRRATRRLGASRRVLGTAFDQSAIGMALVTLDGFYLRVNAAMLDLLGYADGELLGTNYRAITAPEDLAVSVERTARCIAGESDTFTLEKRYLHKDGRRIWTLISVGMVRDGRGRPLHLVVQMQDVTERKEAMAELVRARAAAEAANRAKSAFLANMSHEIRTPMTAIFGYADLMLIPGQPTAERHECVQTIRRNGEHLLSILDDILDLSKVEAGRLRVSEEPASLPLVLGDVLSLMRQRAMAKGIELRLRWETPCPERVVTDPRRLRQILINLVGNAIKFTEVGGVEVSAAITQHPDADAEMRIRIRDTGIGIAPERLEEVFTPFAQGDEPEARRFGGTGLGLSISRRLAALMGGDLTVESARGAGSTFTLTLPAGDLRGVPADERAGDVLLVASPAEVFGRPTRLAGRVLLAEGDPDARRLSEFYLRSMGATVEAVETGEQAVARALGARGAGRPYDVVLMGADLAGLNGPAATIELRARGYAGAVVGAAADAAAAEACAVAGCDGVLAKPIRVEAFFAQMSQFLCRTHEPSREPALTLPADGANLPTDAEARLLPNGQDSERWAAAADRAAS